MTEGTTNHERLRLTRGGTRNQRSTKETMKKWFPS